MKKILTTILFLFSISSLADSNNITGDGNIAISGNNNKVDNTISKVKPDIEYNSETAKNDLETGNYSDIHFEDKDSSAKKSAVKKLLIMTATNFETKVILDIASEYNLEPVKEVINDLIIYKLGILNGIEIYHMQPSMMGMIDPGSTPLVLMSVFNSMKPDYIISTGIAFGRKSKGQELGDVIISRQLVNYETRKESNGDIYFRGDKVTSNLLGRVNSAIHSWDGAKLHVGLILSGNVLVNSKQFLDYLSKREPEYLGGDMESYGVYSVSSMTGAKWIMIKGISDWGDGSKNDDFHELALKNAGSFIFYTVKQGCYK